jgi:hypothetical protein
MKNKIRYAVVGLRYIAQTAVLPAFEQAANSVRSWDFLATLWQFVKTATEPDHSLQVFNQSSGLLASTGCFYSVERGGGNQRRVTKVMKLRIAPSS